jgi:acyl carrier protein phosphodiesterase
VNFLAHAYLARSDDGLLVGGMMGDFVRGLAPLLRYPADIRLGIRLHRHIDRTTDSSDGVKALLRQFPKPFRRYAGIITDVIFDHELARRWRDYSDMPLGEFDVHIRNVLAQHEGVIPEGLGHFMHYADGRGLFRSYREEEEVLRSLTGLGKRLRRANPLHRVDEIWTQVQPLCAETFTELFPQLQLEVDDWIKRKSTSTGS